MRAVIAMIVLAGLLVGCGGISAPVPTPGSMDDVIAGLVLRGATVHQLTSGDAGCPTSELHNNAVHMEISLGTQSASHEIYLLRWRRESDYVNGEQAFADCVAEYQALNPGRPVVTIEADPWRAYGPGWTRQVQLTINDALLAAGGG